VCLAKLYQLNCYVWKWSSCLNDANNDTACSFNRSEQTNGGTGVSIRGRYYEYPYTNRECVDGVLSFGENRMGEMGSLGDSINFNSICCWFNSRNDCSCVRLAVLIEKCSNHPFWVIGTFFYLPSLNSFWTASNNLESSMRS